MARPPARTLQRRLGERILELRHGRGLTQEALAQRTGISQKYLSELERGAKAPSWDTLVAIAHRGLEMKLASLLYAVDEDIAPGAQRLEDVLAGRTEEARYNVIKAVELILKAAESK